MIKNVLQIITTQINNGYHISDTDKRDGLAAINDLLRAIGEGEAVTLKRGQHVEDVYILLPRERDAIIAALRLWQDRDIQKVANDWGRLEALQDIATNGGQSDFPLDENEIDILIDEKINTGAK